MQTREQDEATGANIVRVALTAPLRQIAVNAGLEGGVVVEKATSRIHHHLWVASSASP